MEVCHDDVDDALIKINCHGKKSQDNQFDVSCSRTVDIDISLRSASNFDPSSRGANIIGDTSCLAGRTLKGCLKVETQRDSLSRISHSPSRERVLVTVTEGDAESTSDKVVGFDSVEFREYPRVLSDNPSTSSGPPIGLGWRYDPKETILLDLDSYEACREDTRRTKRELAIPSYFRENMLREAGYSRSEIKAAMKTATKVKQKRRSSIEHQKFDPLVERIETVKKSVGWLLRKEDSVKGGVGRLLRRSSSGSAV